MAQSPADKSIRGLQVDVGLLGGFVVLVVTTVVGLTGGSAWFNSRVDDRIDNYANVNIYPRVVELERNVQQIRKDQQRTIEMIETQDRSRNRQYGEIKGQNDTVLERLKEIQALSIRK